MRTKVLASLVVTLVLGAIAACGSPGTGRGDLVVLESHQFT